MRFKNKWIGLFIAVFITAALMTSAQAQLKRSNPGFYRMQKFGELRCGYVDHPPYIQTDYLTGEVQGPFAQIANNMVEYLRVNVVWVKEDSLANIVSSLNDGKYEAFCGFLPYDTELANHVELTSPVMDLPHYVYAKEGDDRFSEDDLSAFSGMKAYVKQGSLSHLIANSYLQDVEVVLSTKTSTEEFVADFMDSEADLLLGNPVELDVYMRENSEDLNIVVKDPLAITSVTFAVGSQNQSLLKVVNSSIEAVHLTGKVDAIFLEYDMSEDIALREHYKDVYGDRLDPNKMPPCAGSKESKRPTFDTMELEGQPQPLPDSCMAQ